MRGTTMRTVAGPTRAHPTLESLPSTYWTHLRRVRWPGRPDLLIDHLLVGPSGIYVICGPASGRDPSGAASDGAAADGDARGADDVAVERCANNGAVVRGLLPARYHDRVHPVWCVDGDEERADVRAGVLVVSRGALAQVARSSAPVLSTSEVAHARSHLDAHLEHVPLAAGPALPRTGAALRAAAACLALVAASVGALALGPETLDLLGGPR